MLVQDNKTPISPSRIQYERHIYFYSKTVLDRAFAVHPKQSISVQLCFRFLTDVLINLGR